MTSRRQPVPLRDAGEVQAVRENTFGRSRATLPGPLRGELGLCDLYLDNLTTLVAKSFNEREGEDLSQGIGRVA